MIHIIGDRHGELDGFSDRFLPGQSTWTKEDIVIVTGDFGYVKRGEWNYLPEKHKLDVLAKKPYTILFCDGNHEGFDYLEQYPEEIRYNAPVRRIRDNIFWLRRGYIYTIEGKTFFVMGGAYSMDKADSLKYENAGGEKRWFAQELPSAQEYQRAIKNLEDHNNTVDYIITHTAPRLFIPQIIEKYPDDHDQELTGFFHWIYDFISYKKWYFGHFHENWQCDYARLVCCNEQIHHLDD